MIDKKDINEFFISIFKGKSVLCVEIQVHCWVQTRSVSGAKLNLFAVSVLVESHILEYLFLSSYDHEGNTYF